MNNSRTFTRRNGDVVTTTLTFEQACTYIKGATLTEKTQDFVASLRKAYVRYRSFTEAQAAAFYDIANKIANPAPEAVTVSLGDFDTIMGLFRTAKSNLKFPKISFEVDGGMVRLSIAGARSKNAGSVNVTDGRPYGENIWYGRIDTEGDFHPSRNCKEEVVSFLNDFAKDPVEAVRNYGHHSGNCCFCHKQLTDDHSVAAGFGRTCAKNWGLLDIWKTAVKTNKESK